MLAAIDFAVHSVHHTILQATPDQMAFRREMILNSSVISDWEYIRRRKILRMDKNNQNENPDRKPHNYIVRDKLLVNNKKPIKQ